MLYRPMLLFFFGTLGLMPMLASAQAVRIPIDTEHSALSYTGHHASHDWTGTSTAITGQLRVDVDRPDGSEVALRIPVASFDSGNRSRDANMLKTLEADLYPEVLFQSEIIDIESWQSTPTGYQGRWLVRGRLTFHGQTHEEMIPVDVTIQEDAFEAHALFQVSLKRYDVRRPRLLMVPVREHLTLESTIRATLPPVASGD